MNTQSLLEQLYQGQSLAQDEIAHIFQQLLHGVLSHEQIAALLIALKVKGETIDEITGAASALRAAALSFPTPSHLPHILDIVGTGGDGHHTINISTTATFVVAAAGGYVAKHGNRGVSSQSGASDVLSALGLPLTVAPEIAAQTLSEHGMCFLFAPHYHTGVKYAVPVRQALKTRTLFNILGPLINPAKPTHMLLGVYDKTLLEPIAYCLGALGVKRAMVVYGSGLDEVALHDVTDVAELNQGQVRCYQLSPQDFELPAAPLSALVGGTPTENAKFTQAILAGQGLPAHNHAVAINAACALYLAEIAPTLTEAAKLALATIHSGKGLSLLQQLTDHSSTETTPAKKDTGASA